MRHICLRIAAVITSTVAVALMTAIAQTSARPEGGTPMPPLPPLEGVFSVKDFGARGGGITDDTAAIQAAAGEAAKLGGVVYLPPGKYLVSGSIRVPVGVALVGANQAPLYIEPLIGSVVCATGGRDNENAPALFEMGSSSTVAGLTVFYPDQKPDDIHPYPWTFHLQGGDNTVENVTLINSYNGISVGPEPNVRHRIRSVYGCVLRRGLVVDSCSDIGRVENVQFHCHWWSSTAIGGNWQPVYDYMWQNLEAFVFARTDWEYVTNTFVFPAKIGYRFIKSANGACNGQFCGIGADATENCVVVDEIQPMGLLITNGQFVSFNGTDPTEIVINPTCTGQVRFVNCAFWGPVKQNALLKGQSFVSFADCYFSNSSDKEDDTPLLQAEGGRLQVRGCSFATRQPAIRLGQNVEHAIIADNNCPTGLMVLNDIGPRAIVKDNE
jgi:hypothetical protein